MEEAPTGSLKVIVAVLPDNVTVPTWLPFFISTTLLIPLKVPVPVTNTVRLVMFTVELLLLST